MKQAQTSMIIKFKNLDEKFIDEEEIEITRCPWCNGIFGVDSSYLDQNTDEIICPMCEEEVRMPEVELGRKVKTYKLYKE
jgi:hypothetical protein